MTTAKIAYALLWLDDGHDPVLNTLVYRGPDGPQVRTYFEGHLDARAGNEDLFPRFETQIDAWQWLAENRGKKCLVAVRAAKGLYQAQYADPV